MVRALALAVQASLATAYWPSAWPRKPSAEEKRTKFAAHAQEQRVRRKPDNMDMISAFRAEMCATREEDQSGYEQCKKFMIDHCHPGDDMIMNGDPGETDTAGGHCKKYFNRMASQAQAAAPAVHHHEHHDHEHPTAPPDPWAHTTHTPHAVGEDESWKAVVETPVFKDKDPASEVVGHLKPGQELHGISDGDWLDLQHDPRGFVTKMGTNGANVILWKNDYTSEYVEDSNPPDESRAHHHMDVDRLHEFMHPKPPREFEEPKKPKTGAWDWPPPSWKSTSPIALAQQARETRSAGHRSGAIVAGVATLSCVLLVN